MKKIKVNRILSFRDHGPEEKTWPEREDVPPGGLDDEDGGGESGTREPRVDPPGNAGSGQERAIPSDGEE